MARAGLLVAWSVDVGSMVTWNARRRRWPRRWRSVVAEGPEALTPYLVCSCAEAQRFLDPEPTKEEMTMSARYLHLVRMDVAHDHETAFNEIYEREHIPALQAVPGVGRASRYRHPSPTDPRYIAADELESPAVLHSAQWKTAAESGR